ncbi:MAG: hypothetical protein J6Y87_02425 [Muribaculaceae bacterium]|nr:hypothetical protein [Muribaculaceae bacterium]MBP5314706.1 hypothetical protein [Muribaculaceae bacterium]
MNEDSFGVDDAITTEKRSHGGFGMFILGILVGAGLTVGGYFGYNYFSGRAERANYHYFDVEIDKNVVTLHTGMSRDSVTVLMGLPVSSESAIVGRHFNETLEYNTSGGLTPDLELKFVDGKLTEYHHNATSSDVLKSLEKGVGSLFEELLTP